MSSVTSFDHTVSSNLGRCLQPKYRLDSSSSGRPTPGTANSSSRSLRSYTLVSVYEGHSLEKGQLGMAVMDLRFPEVNLYEFIDANYLRLMTRIHVEDPIEIIVADSVADRTKTLLLIESIKNSIADATITTVDKRFFSEEKGASLIRQLANREVSDCGDVVLEKKKLAVAACGGLLKYVEFIQNMILTDSTLKIQYRDIEKNCMIDPGSWKCLELIDSSDMNTSKQSRRSLISVIDYTLTPGGYRLLRSNLLQPMADKQCLEQRYEAVEELCETTHLVERLREILQRIGEVDGILALCAKPPNEPNVSKCESNIVQLQRLRKTLDMVIPMRNCLHNVKSESLRSLRKKLMDNRVEKMIKMMDEVLDTSALSVTKKNSLVVRNQKCYAVKRGLCVQLDIARKTYEELVADLQDEGTGRRECTKELEENLPDENTRVAYSITRGFHYVWVVKNAEQAKLPAIFQNEVRSRASITFTSRHLIRYNDRINQCVADIMLVSSRCVEDLLSQLRDFIPVLYNIAEATVCLDFMASLTMYSISTDTVRPVLGNALMFKDGRNPLLDHHLKDQCVANDTYLSPEAHFGIITGPNMAGKSTYLRQVCHLSILAQLGCLIPAELASVPVYKYIFSRVGHNDMLSKGLSAFSMEMKEMALILHYANERTLIVVDELARSTSTEEGIAISIAVCEYLLQKKSTCLLATHFLDLASLDQRFTSVENYHFPSQAITDRHGNEAFVAAHKLHKGAYNGPIYGFELAQLSTFPSSVIEKARKLANQLKTEKDRNARISREAAKKKILVRTAVKLRHALVLRDTASKEVMIKYLEDVRSHTMRKLRQLEMEVGDEGDLIQDRGDAGEEELDMENEEELPPGEAVTEDNY